MTNKQLRAFAWSVFGAGTILLGDVVNPNGDWDVTAIGNNGRTYTMQLHIASDRGKLGGFVSTPAGKVALEDIRLSGQELSYILPTQSGLLHVKLTVTSNSLKGVYRNDAGKGGTLSAVPAIPPAPVAPVSTTVTETNLRHLATTIIKPAFPASAVRAAESGVAVATVHVDQLGHVTKTELVEATTSSFGIAVLEAVKLWQFKSMTLHGAPATYYGKITYYFVLASGRPGVLDPDQYAVIAHPRPR